MTKQERLDTRHIFQRTFRTQEGKAVLSVILNDLGFFSTDQSQINPVMIAYAHRLLGYIGINTVPNIGAYVDSIVDCSTDKDIQEEE